MQTQSTQFDFTGQNIYVGIDTHLKSWNVTVMMDPYYQKTFSQNADARTLLNHLEENYPGGSYFSAYEAGFAGFMPHYRLLELGIQSMVVNPADVPTTGKEKVQKNDSRDSKKIARSLKNGELTPIYIPSLETLADRSLVRLRKTIARDLARTKTQIKSFLHCNGIDIPEVLSKEKWTRKFVKWLAEVEIGFFRETLEGHLAKYYYFHGLKLDINRKVKALSQTPRYRENMELLESIPGVGYITAITFLTEIENIKRFKSLDRLCGFIGLVPSTNSSGEKDRVGEITPRGHRILRDILIEASWKAIGKDPALGATYARLGHRMKANKAIIRITKKILSRMRFVLNNQTRYELGYK